MKAEPAISSNFCEYRDGHLHAGIDIRSFGREGIECVAAADGYVSRVRATPTGYGQAVYLQLDDGQTLVYAHLSQFAPAIDSAVVSQQLRAGKYSVDFRPPKDRLRVRRGDVIAYSGSTGGVDPHLHFEVRSDKEHPRAHHVRAS
jgi:murein DD-endopeptidase MepM/ murein hydrolase activator NlpD